MFRKILVNIISGCAMKDFFKDRLPDFSKFEDFGFVKEGDVYSYKTEIADGQFEMRVEVYTDGAVKTKVVDKGTGEPYTLHLVEDAGGSFVGGVREEYGRVLSEISKKCFVSDVFKSGCARDLIKYVRDKYGCELQFLWEKFPQDAVWRRCDNGKWFAVLMKLPKTKLGLDSGEITDIIDLRIEPSKLDILADGQRFFRGYHMNKKSWITVCLDGTVSFEEICSLLDDSYELARKC